MVLAVGEVYIVDSRGDHTERIELVESDDEEEYKHRCVAVNFISAPNHFVNRAAIDLLQLLLALILQANMYS